MKKHSYLDEINKNANRHIFEKTTLVCSTQKIELKRLLKEIPRTLRFSWLIYKWRLVTMKFLSCSQNEHCNWLGMFFFYFLVLLRSYDNSIYDFWNTGASFAVLVNHSHKYPKKKKTINEFVCAHTIFCSNNIHRKTNNKY